ncbi:NAD+ synthase [Methanogenium sp. MK-MG]|uniref:NAD+ synthase n=1 Tax=Methanogenium sp. MK-MG TaxID=2599926 RepID=UPI0013EA294E|nr:NAD+ synthase [Methanogenium sp. MK-MG]KAF1078345.1 NH(3)-dependent NAD(+) synthetase [Methanogenium sp. MK-MG]
MKQTCEIGCECERIEQMIRHTLWSSGAKGFVVGISGGVDSALAAVLCARAVGGERVLGIALPSPVTPDADLRDGKDLCAAFDIPFKTIPIEPMLSAFAGMEGFEKNSYLSGNLMARIRMTTLYYHANRLHYLVCGTSNRSEYMLGYSTKYGDSAADIQPILHCYKTRVYALAKEVGVPAPIIEKPPSAGLWPGQSDEAEIGLTYATIDSALISLEANNWTASNAQEELILGKVQASMHKRMTPPNLLEIP